MARGKLHVVPKDGGWAVKREGTSKASRVYSTKAKALDAAQRMAWKDDEEVTVHGKSGEIKKGKKRGKNPDDDNCFITTACIRHYNLPDDCYQLTTLRTFRDSYLKSIKGGKSLIKQYYSVAPKLVKVLNEHPNKRTIFRRIFLQINAACTLIEQRKNERAKRLYIKTVSTLIKKFPLV